MAQSSNSDPLSALGAGTGITLILALIFTNNWTHRLNTARAASQADMDWAPPLDAQQIPARLWQDPLAAAYSAWKQTARDSDARKIGLGVPPPRSIESLRASILSPCGGPTTVIAMLVPGGNTSDAGETRVRCRFAAVSALGVAGFSPVDGEALGYASLSIAPSCDDIDPAHGTPIIVPFEWFSSSSPVARRTLVAWIDEDVIRNAPLCRMGAILGELCDRDGSRTSCSGPHAPVTVRIVGPSNSGMLVKFAADDEHWLKSCAGDKAVFHGVRMYSAWATLSSFAEGVDACTLPGSELEFVRAVGTDDELAHVLLDELMLRSPDKFDGHVRGCLAVLRKVLEWSQIIHSKVGCEFHVALVTERDTEYGRSWRAAFERDATKRGLLAADASDGAKSSGAKAADQVKDHSTFQLDTSVQYLRGLDGAGVRVASGDAPAASGPPSTESAIGPSQLDYLRRLDRQLEGKEFDAIGVLGSDEYDKLAILETLRPRFPNAIFFTTDLDARLLPSSSNRNSLNLLVASHYGLVLHPGLQRGLAPFRSSYQAATYVAVLQAADHLDAKIAQLLANVPPAPWIYEIGRTWAFPLCVGEHAPFKPVTGKSHDQPSDGFAPVVEAHDVSTIPEQSQPSTAQPLALLMPRSVPSRSDAAPVSAGAKSAPNLELEDRARTWVLRKPKHLIGCGVVVVVLAYCAWLLRTLRNRTRQVWGAFAPRERVALFIASAVISYGLIGLWLFIQRQDRSPSGEPMYWVEGMSIWPTVLLRVLAAIVSGVGIVKVAADMRMLTRTVDHELRDYDAADFARAHVAESNTTRAGGFRSWMSRAFAWLLDPEWNTSSNAHAEFVDSWAGFKERARFRRLCLRAARNAAIYYALTGGLFALLGGERVPTRGEASYVVERATLFLAIVTLVFLMFLVLRTATVTKAFLRRMEHFRPESWPQPALDRCSKATGLPRAESARIVVVCVAHRIASCVGRFIWYPAISVSLLIVSRSGLFARWSWPAALVVTFCACFGLLLISARNIRRVAQKLRENEIHGLTMARLEKMGDDSYGRRITLAIEELGAIRTGVFAPVLEHPLLRAGVLPVLGLSANSIAETVVPLLTRMT